MSVLILTAEDRENISIAIRLARANPIPWDEIEKLAVDHKPQFDEKRAQLADEVYKKYPTQCFTFGNISVAFSFEYQPAGFMRHLSVALANGRPRAVPGYEVVKMLALEFGFSGFPPTNAYRIWTEEFESQRFAVNVIELDEPRESSNDRNDERADST